MKQHKSKKLKQQKSNLSHVLREHTFRSYDLVQSSFINIYNKVAAHVSDSSRLLYFVVHAFITYLIDNKNKTTPLKKNDVYEHALDLLHQYKERELPTCSTNIITDIISVCYSEKIAKEELIAFKEDYLSQFQTAYCFNNESYDLEAKDILSHNDQSNKVAVTIKTLKVIFSGVLKEQSAILIK